MIKVYLSGKMTGLDKGVYELNFMKVAQFYKSCGYVVVNPCDIAREVLKKNPEAEYEDFMEADLKALKECTHIAMLEGWTDSAGAKREKAEAERLGLEVMFLKFIGGKK